MVTDNYQHMQTKLSLMPLKPPPRFRGLSRHEEDLAYCTIYMPWPTLGCANIKKQQRTVGNKWKCRTHDSVVRAADVQDKFTNT